MAILTQFLFRLAFGLAWSMALTPSRFVTSGYYRVHLYVLLGLNVFLTLIAYSHHSDFALWPPLLGAVLSYVGSVIWLYEKRNAGTVLLFLVGLVAIIGALLATRFGVAADPLEIGLGVLDLITSGLLLGVTMAAMLLGHWYLNTPTMELVPLRRLVALMFTVALARTLLCAIGPVLYGWPEQSPGQVAVAFIVLRWLSGLIGTLVLAVMAWQTLKVPNTQSATGILYVGVIATFTGELAAQLLSVGTLYPL